MRYTYTYSILPVSRQAYSEIRVYLAEAGYSQQFHEVDGREVIDMHGLALQAKEEAMPEETVDTRTARQKFPILDFFEFSHLPENLQQISAPFAQLAHDMASKPTTHPDELAAGLRKLLEAKDCAVRAAL